MSVGGGWDSGGEAVVVADDNYPHRHKCLECGDGMPLLTEIDAIQKEARRWLAATGYFPEQWRAGRDAALDYFLAQIDSLMETLEAQS